jgi:hypothetical protein
MPLLNAAIVPNGRPEAKMKFDQYAESNPRSSWIVCVFMPPFSTSTRQPSALRGIVSRAGVVPLAEMLLAHLIVAFAPDGSESTLMISFDPCLIVAQEVRRHAVITEAKKRFTISPASPLRSL